MKGKEKVVIIVILSEIGIACLELENADDLRLEPMIRVVNKTFSEPSFNHNYNKPGGRLYRITPLS